MKRALLFAAVLFVLSPLYTFAQQDRPSRPEVPMDEAQASRLEELKAAAPRVFIDCRMCDRDYFREEITYVNYVRDRKDADIHVLVTNQSTGSGGQEYTFAFIGLREFEGLNFNLVYASNPTDTRDDTRKGQVTILRRGLYPYLLNTPICELINLDFIERVELKPTDVKDPWNFWVFSANLDVEFQSEVSVSERQYDANLSANRITPDWKFRMGLSGEFNEKDFNYDGESLTSKQEEKNLATMAVKSLNGHWSVGGYVEAEQNTYSNTDLYFTIAPAVEFNVFPYAESTRRQLRFLYRLGYNPVSYTHLTLPTTIKPCRSRGSPDH